MTTQIDYALLAANSYAVKREVTSSVNEILPPDGWEIIDYRRDDLTGFTARAYTNGSEICIAYTGTTFEGAVNNVGDWLLGNITAGSGSVLAPQVIDAAKFYLDILKDNPDANITFTGHSLGGGLASLMAVYFDEPATVFDEAPFAKSADSALVVNGLKAALAADPNYSLPDAFASYIALDPLFGTILPSPSRIARESNVSAIYVKDEILSLAQTTTGRTVLPLLFAWNPALFAISLNVTNISGNEQVIEANATSGNGWELGVGIPDINGNVDLHYMPLLTAFLQSNDFLMACQNNPEILQEIFTSEWNVDSSNARVRNFLNLMVQRQQVQGENPEDPLGAFAADIGRLKGKLATGIMKSVLVELGIDLEYAQGMEHAMGVTAGKFEPVFKELTGGIQIEHKTEDEQWVSKGFSQLDRELRNAHPDLFSISVDRYSLATEGDLVITAPSDTKRDLMLGGAGSDMLIGGDGDDQLVGGAGSDTLDGGAGVDYYIVEGNDTIRDSDGLGLIKDKSGNIITGAIKHNADGSYTFTTHPGISVTRDANLTLTLADGSTIVIETHNSGDLGLQISDAVQPQSLLFGMDKALYNGADTLNSNTSCEMHGGLGNDILHASVEADLLYGEDGHDAIFAGEGNDELRGGFGNDLVNGGLGDDLQYGEEGHDLMVGQGGNDVLYGGEGDDWLFAGSSFGTIRIVQSTNDSNYPSLAAINSPDFEGFVRFVDGVAVPELEGMYFVGETGSNNLLDGGVGDDHLLGDSGIDILLGGTGADMLYGFSEGDMLNGGEGNDTLHGDVTQGNYTTVNAYGETASIYALPEFHGNDILEGGTGDDQLIGDGGSDTLLGGDGNDQIFGDSDKLDIQWHGNDYLDGGAGDDTLVGNGGNDTLYGGTGVDQMWGGIGDDTLDGGIGNDTLWGGNGNDTLIGDAGDDKLYGEAGSNHLDGGNGNDTLNTGGSTNTLFGGTGNDTLQAAGGGSYLDGGDGTDTLIAVDGNNTLFSGAGDDDLQAGGGNNYLDGEDGNNTLFADGGNNTLIGGAGNDTLSAAGGNNYLDGGEGTNTLIADGGSNTLMAGSGDDTLSSTGGNSTLDGGGGNDTLAADGGGNTLMGGADNDILRGGDGNDMLNGGTGNDVLDGGAGNDTLTGGGGADAFIMDFGMGMDILADASAAGGTLQLNQIAIANLTFMKQGQDLLIQIAANDGLLLKNYYSYPQATWTIQDASNTATTVQTQLDGISTASKSEIEQAESNFLIKARNSIISEYLVQGYSMQNDGTLYRAWSNDLFAYNTVNYTTTDVTQYLNSGNIVHLPTTQSSTQTWSPMYGGWYGEPTLHENIVSIRESGIFTDLAVVNANTYSQSVGSGGAKWLQTTWTTIPVQTWSELTGTSTLYMYEQGFSSDPNATNLGLRLGSEVITTVQSHVQSAAYGSVVNVLASPGDLQADGSLPQTVAAQSTIAQMTFDVLSITLGDAGQTVYGDVNTMVHGGNGDDTIFNAGLAFGGDGNDTIMDTATQFGDSGNDTLINGQLLNGGDGDDHLYGGGVLNGGTGNDTMDGAGAGIYGTRYVIDPTQTGIDTIHDTGDYDAAYKDWFYGQRGITNWEEHEQHGGMYRIDNDGDICYLTPEQFHAEYPSQIDNLPRWASFMEPLPPLNRPAAYDYAALQAAYDAGVIQKDTLEFTAGVTLSDLQLSWGETDFYRTLILSWNGGASQVKLVIPHADDPLGSGVEQIQFADGTVVAMQDLIALAPAGVSLDPRYDLVLVGTANTDVLNGQSGNDLLIGLGGDDVLAGGAGDDTYLINVGDGVDTIIDDFTGTENNSIVFGTGIDPARIGLFQGSLGIDLGNGSVVHIQGVDYDDIANTCCIRSFQFADGTELTVQQLVERGFDIAGSAGADILSGTNVVDRIEGGAGNDTLIGGAGDDIYLYNIGDGADIILDDVNVAAGGTEINTLVLGAGITADMISTSVDANGMVTLDFIPSTGSGQVRDSIRINHFGNLSVQNIQFADGSVIATESLVSVPLVAVPDMVATTEDTAQVSIAAAALLSNDIAGSAIILTGVDAVTAQGNAVTMGADCSLTVDFGDRYQALAEGQTATDSFGYTVSDTAGATSAATVTMTINGSNDAPVTSGDIGLVQEDYLLTATGSVLENDSDVDQGDVLTVANAGTQQGVYGSLALAEDGSYSYELGNVSQSVQALDRNTVRVEQFGYTATDSMVGTSDVLNIFVVGANDAPILVAPLEDKEVVFNKSFSWQMPEGSFTDIDQGDTLTYTAVLADGSALPDWLVFDPATRTFSGTAPRQTGAVDVAVIATDMAADGSMEGSLAAYDVFRINVARGNEGAGNGDDAPLPGHDSNHDNGHGTSPGHSGSRGRDHARDEDNGRKHRKDDHEDEAIREWFGKDKSGHRDNCDGLGRSDDRIDHRVNRNVSRGIDKDYSRQWAQMNVRLREHLAQSGSDDHFDSGIGHASPTLFGAGGYQGLAQPGWGEGAQMKAFAGLKEGLERLGC
ncbi:MAG: putative Ig domain-containing protein [Nitrosomonadales bacterium]|nr:putative Ig domain-containing protein [Nitrosomonadales bacterium]